MDEPKYQNEIQATSTYSKELMEAIEAMDRSTIHGLITGQTDGGGHLTVYWGTSTLWQQERRRYRMTAPSFCRDLLKRLRRSHSPAEVRTSIDGWLRSL